MAYLHFWYCVVRGSFRGRAETFGNFKAVHLLPSLMYSERQREVFSEAAAPPRFSATLWAPWNAILDGIVGELLDTYCWDSFFFSLWGWVGRGGCVCVLIHLLMHLPVEARRFVSDVFFYPLIMIIFFLCLRQGLSGSLLGRLDGQKVTLCLFSVVVWVSELRSYAWA